MAGEAVMAAGQKVYSKGNNNITLNTSRLKNGIYYYSFQSDDLNLTGKLVISK